MRTRTDAKASTLSNSADPDTTAMPVGPAPAFQFYPQAWLSSATVGSLTLEEKGVYITLLAYDWGNDGLPTDLDALAHLVGIQKRRFVRIWEKIEKKFPLTDGAHRNLKLHAQRQETAAFRAKQAEKANKRWAKERCHGIPTALPEQCSLSITTTTTASGPQQLPIDPTCDPLLEELLRRPEHPESSRPGYWEQVAQECAELDEYLPEYLMYLSEFKEWKENGGFGPFTRQPPPKPEFLKYW